MKHFTQSQRPITVARIEAACDRVAIAIAKAGADGAAYLPIYQRLEYELAAAKEREGALASALSRVARLASDSPKRLMGRKAAQSF